MLIVDVDKRWADWCLENVALGVPPEAMLPVMLKADVPQQTAMELLDNIQKLPGYTTVRKLAHQVKKLESFNLNHQKLLDQDPSRSDIERVSGLSRESFFNDYWLKNKPVIITDFLDHCDDYEVLCMQYLLDNYGDEVVEIQEAREKDPEFEINSISHKSTMSMSGFIKRIMAAGETNDFYMTANNMGVKKTRLSELLKFLMGVPRYCVAPTVEGHNGMLWVGPKGTKTPLHHDECGILHPHLHGSKRWIMISPNYSSCLYNHEHVFSEVDIFDIDYAKFPKMEKVKMYDVTLKQGETLFIPVNWWHAVQSLSPCISFTLTGFPYENTWSYHRPSRWS